MERISTTRSAPGITIGCGVSAFLRARRSDCHPSPAPALSLTAGGDGYYTLMDTRGVEGTELFQFLDEEEARTVLIGGPIDRQPLAEWAIERKLAVALDGWCVPLAVTDVETWRRFEARTLQTAGQAISAAV